MTQNIIVPQCNRVMRLSTHTHPPVECGAPGERNRFVENRPRLRRFLMFLTSGLVFSTRSTPTADFSELPEGVAKMRFIFYRQNSSRIRAQWNMSK